MNRQDTGRDLEIPFYLLTDITLKEDVGELELDSLVEQSNSSSCWQEKSNRLKPIYANKIFILVALMSNVL